MRLDVQHKVSSIFEPRLSDQRRLSLLYRNLSEYLEAVSLVAHSCPHPDGQALAVVLEEDLCSLCQECEEYLISGALERREAILSFESRSSTILEEVQQLLKREDAQAAALPRSFRLN